MDQQRTGMKTPGPGSRARSGFDRRMTREEINARPIKKWTGPIHLIRTREEVQEAARRLGRERLLGFDTETRPAFRKGQRYLPSLLQLAGEQEVWIFQLRAIGLPQPVRAILSDPAIIKAGVSIDFDIRELQRIASFRQAGFVDIGRMARKAGIRNHGLRGLAAVLLDLRITKTAQTSNWAREQLTPAQLTYAATDAWVSREIHLALAQMT